MLKCLVGFHQTPKVHLCCTKCLYGVQVKKANDEREAAENARIAADVAAADRRAQEVAQKLAEKRRKMQQDCDKARLICCPHVICDSSRPACPRPQNRFQMLFCNRLRAAKSGSLKWRLKMTCVIAAQQQVVFK